MKRLSLVVFKVNIDLCQGKEQLTEETCLHASMCLLPELFCQHQCHSLLLLKFIARDDCKEDSTKHQ